MNPTDNHPLYNCLELVFKATIVIFLLLHTLAVPVYAQIAATEEDAVEYFNKGLEYAKQGKLNDAKEKFTWAITVKPDYTAAYYNLATVLMKKNDVTGAIDYYKQALTLDPQSYLTHNGLGYAYSKVGLWSKAIEEYNTAINIKPDFTPAHENLGQAYVALKEWDLARQEYQKLVELRSPNANSLLKQIPKVIEPPKARLISLMPLESTTVREDGSPSVPNEVVISDNGKNVASDGRSYESKPVSIAKKENYMNQSNEKENSYNLIMLLVGLIGLIAAYVIVYSLVLARKKKRIADSLTELMRYNEPTERILQELRRLIGSNKPQAEEEILITAWGNLLEGVIKKPPIINDDTEILLKKYQELFPQKTEYWSSEYQRRFSKLLILKEIDKGNFSYRREDCPIHVDSRQKIAYMQNNVRLKVEVSVKKLVGGHVGGSYNVNSRVSANAGTVELTEKYVREVYDQGYGLLIITNNFICFHNENITNKTSLSQIAKIDPHSGGIVLKIGCGSNEYLENIDSWYVTKLIELLQYKYD